MYIYIHVYSSMPPRPNSAAPPSLLGADAAGTNSEPWSPTTKPTSAGRAVCPKWAGVVGVWHMYASVHRAGGNRNCKVAMGTEYFST